MRRTLISSSVLLALTASLCRGQREPLLVTAVRFWSLSEVTRVAIETNGEFRYRSDHLENPARVFFDLLGAKPRMGVRGIHTTPVNDRLLKRIRVAETQPGTTRIVLDLEASAEYSASQLSNPDRLIIELRAMRPAGAPAAAPPPRQSVSGGEKLPVTEKLPASEPSQIPESPRGSDPAPGAPPAAPQAVPLIEDRRESKPDPVETARVDPKLQELPAAPAPKSVPAAPRAAAAKRNSSGGRTLVRTLGLKVNRVVLDPGHGGHDRGSTGPGGLMEKELVFDVARRLGALIEERMGSEVIYTRSDDTFVPLERRTEIANESKADLFLSIHANSSPYPSVAGVETYYLNFASSREAMDLAARENAGSQQSIHELTDIIQRITKHDKAQESKEFASRMQASLYNAVNRSNPAAKNRGVKKAPFVVLIGATMPSILAEIGFVSNTREELLLKRPDHRQRLAEALYRGLSRYAETLSHFQVATAKN